MATTQLTTNLKLRVSSDLTSDAIYNLNKLDTLGLSNKVDSTGTYNLKSAADIRIEPNSTDLGGTGVGGKVTVGQPGVPIESFQINADNLLLRDCSLKFSDGVNAVTLTLPTLSTSTTYILPASDGSSGEVLKTNGSGTLSWGTLSDITNSQISTSAGISLSKLETIATDKVLISSSTGIISTSSVSPTELSYLSGATSNLQAQINLLGGANQLTTEWVPGDGLTKTITHGFNTRNIIVQVLNSDNDYSTIDVESITRPTDTTVVLTASELPVTSWTILLTQVGT